MHCILSDFLEMICENVSACFFYFIYLYKRKNNGPIEEEPTRHYVELTKELLISPSSDVEERIN